MTAASTYDDMVDFIFATTLLLIVCVIVLGIILVCGTLYLYGLELLRRDDDDEEDDRFIQRTPTLQDVEEQRLGVAASDVPVCPFTHEWCYDAACQPRGVGCARRTV